MKDFFLQVHNIRNFILHGFSFIYLSAFLSFYVSSKALFGENGILPARAETITGGSFGDKYYSFLKDPNLLRVFNLIGFDTFAGIEIITLLGSVISFLGLVFESFRVLPTFTILWYFYYSLIGVTGIFQQQSDELLLEAGVVCILLAPLSTPKKYGISDNCVMILMRWVLFRFLFSSGAVKLASGCPHWWNLSALQHHMETLPMPTSLAFYSFYLPPGFLKLTTVFVNVSELVCPWFFFAPVRSLRILAFYWQLFLQLNIIATGNYGFLNFMIIIMLLSLLDDQHFGSNQSSGLSIRKIFSLILTIATFCVVLLLTASFYRINWVNNDFQIDILFKKAEYMELIRQMVKLSPFVVTITIINVFLQSCITHPNITDTKSILAKAFYILQCLFFTLFCIAMIGVSTVPHGNLHPSTNISQSNIAKYYETCKHFHMIHEYGNHLRKMRSERLELVFEFTNSVNAETAVWKEYDFVYKPGNDRFVGPYLGPYFSRLDFKLHAAMGAGAKLQNNLWLASMIRGLLRNNKELLQVMSPSNVQKVKGSPKFVRVLFYRLRYVPKGSPIESGLFIREKLSEYLPPLSMNSQELKDLLADSKITFKKESTNYAFVHNYLNLIRSHVESNVSGHFLILSILFSGFIIILVKRLFLKVF